MKVQLSTAQNSGLFIIGMKFIKQMQKFWVEEILGALLGQKKSLNLLSL